MRKGTIVKKCPDCRELFGCSDTKHQRCDEDCTTKEDCEILKTSKHSELELCPDCLKTRKEPDAVSFFSGVVKRFIAG